LAKRISGRSTTGRKPSDEKRDFRPTRDEILAFIKQNPDQAGKRELGRAFGLKGADKIWLKAELKELQDEGLLKKQSKRFASADSLPHVSVLDVFSRDPDGNLIARPAEWTDSNGNVPLVSIRPSRDTTRTPGIGDRILAKVFPTEEDEGPAYTARIIRIFEKRREAVLGVLRQLRDGTFRIEPVERRQAELIVDKDYIAGAKPGDLVEVEQTTAGRYGLPKAKVLNVLGSLSSEKAVSMIAIHAHDIPYIFPREVIEEAEAAPAATLNGREDWRKLPLITIDPADAKDHDDAVHAEPDTDENNVGGHIVTVAIADVAAYITNDSALDREALKRGNSVYFPDRVVPMLPERISNDLCSLREGEDRPAMAVRMTFGADGRKIRHSFHRIMMKSAAKLSYQQAQAAIDGEADDKTRPLLDPILKPLWTAYEALRRGRNKRQPLELDLPERKILLKEDGTVDRVIVPDRLDAHKLIEECMIQANVAAAETLEAKRKPLVYRVHDAPSMAKQEALREFLQTVGLSLSRGAQMRPASFNGILSQVQGSEHESLVNEVVLRTQSQAVYSPDNLGHFGLNLTKYAHFTSPIRRYADLIVHRALISALGLGKDGISNEQEARLEEIAALISTSERRAMAAERDTVDRLIAEHLSSRLEESFQARISGVTKSGLFVQLPQFGADGFIPISTLGSDYYIFDESARALFGEKSKRGYQLADTVDVKLVEVLPLAGAMRFEMLSEPKPLPGSRQSYHKASRAKDRAKGKAPSRGARRR
jgi:ribonuclease R